MHCSKPTISYLFDSIIHNISDDCDLFLLPKSQSPANSLSLDSRIPLRLHEIYSACYCQIQPIEIVLAFNIRAGGKTYPTAPVPRVIKRTGMSACVLKISRTDRRCDRFRDPSRTTKLIFAFSRILASL